MERKKSMLSELCDTLTGKQATKGQPPLPEWTTKAIKVLFGASRQFAGLRAFDDPTAKLTPESLGMIASIMGTQTMILAGQEPGTQTEEEKNPELKRFREQLFSSAAPHLKQAIDQLQDPENAQLPEMTTTRDLLAYHSGEYKASSSLLDEDGKLREESLTNEILMHLWLFRQEVEKLSSARELHEFLENDMAISCSFKLVEKICAKISLEFRKRGRPKKILPKAKAE